MLTALRLGNFKAFADTQRIPIKPLTLIFGPNSAGKSSILHGLLLGHQAITTGELDVHRTNIGGQAVDLGGFRQYVHCGQTRNTVEWGLELDSANLPARLKDLFAGTKQLTVSVQIGLRHVEKTAYYGGLDPDTKEHTNFTYSTGELIAIGAPFVQRYEIATDGQVLLRMSRRSLANEELLRLLREMNVDFQNATSRLGETETSGRLQLDLLNHDHPVMQTLLRALVDTATTTALTQSDYAGLREVIDQLVPTLMDEKATFLPTTLASETKRVVQQGAETEMPSVDSPHTLFPVSRGNRTEDLAEAVKLLLPRRLSEVLQFLRANAELMLTNLHYLGPLRSYPPRHMAFSEHDDPNWYAGGGHAWDVVRRDGNVRAKVNGWLGDKTKLSTPYELTIRHLLTIDELDKHYQGAIRHIENHFEDLTSGGDLFGEIYGVLSKMKEYQANMPNVPELSLVDKRTGTLVSHRDVGIGISQILPVLVAAYGTESQIHAIEQPEIHLHPALQAELGDVFIESALGLQKNVFLLETHSEHLILRIMRRMRETAERKLPAGLPVVRPEDVSILFVEPDGPRSIVREMPLNERGELVKAWPNGFFEEGLRELFDNALDASPDHAG